MLVLSTSVNSVNGKPMGVFKPAEAKELVFLTKLQELSLNQIINH